MTDKTYEDGVRDGFEACRKAASETCFQDSERIEERAGELHAAGDAELAFRYICMVIALCRAGSAIAALTPESPND